MCEEMAGPTCDGTALLSLRVTFKIEASVGLKSARCAVSPPSHLSSNATVAQGLRLACFAYRHAIESLASKTTSLRCRQHRRGFHGNPKPARLAIGGASRRKPIMRQRSPIMTACSPTRSESHTTVRRPPKNHGALGSVSPISLLRNGRNGGSAARHEREPPCRCARSPSRPTRRPVSTAPPTSFTTRRSPAEFTRLGMRCPTLTPPQPPVTQSRAQGKRARGAKRARACMRPDMSVRALIRAQGSLQCLLAAAPPVAAYPIMQLKKTVEKFAPLPPSPGWCVVFVLVCAPRVCGLSALRSSKLHCKRDDAFLSSDPQPTPRLARRSGCTFRAKTRQDLRNTRIREKRISSV